MQKVPCNLTIEKDVFVKFSKQCKERGYSVSHAVNQWMRYQLDMKSELEKM
jgi:hypothetical protein